MKYRICQVRPGVTLIDDPTGSSAWLITGTASALLIDTGWTEGDFYGMIRTLTDLPVTLFVSHAHLDHYRHVPAFEQVYMHRADWELLPLIAQSDSTAPAQSAVTPVDEGFTFDLGSVHAQVILAAGHTPGSAVVAVPEYHCMFTGDAFGSGIGVWMQVPHALTISEYRDSLRRYLEKTSYAERFTYCGGHEQQGHENPLCHALVRDMLTLCEKLLQHDDAVQISPSDAKAFTEEPVQHASYKTAGMEYLPSLVR